MGDEIFPILATIILVATLITLIVAVVSYVIFRVKEKHRAEVGLVQEELSKTEPGEIKPSVPHMRGVEGGAAGDESQAGGGVPGIGSFGEARPAPPLFRAMGQSLASEQSKTSFPETESKPVKPPSEKPSAAKQVNLPQGERRRAREEEPSEAEAAIEETSHYEDNEDEVELSSAQSAFLEALKNIEKNGDDRGREPLPPPDRLKFRQFTPRDDSRERTKPSQPRDDSARWK